MADGNDFSDLLNDLAKDIAAEARIAIDDAKKLLANVGPLVLRWEQEARAAEAAGDDELAASKRTSIRHIRAAAVLDIAQHSVVAQDKLERAILTAFDRAIALLP